MSVLRGRGDLAANHIDEPADPFLRFVAAFKSSCGGRGSRRREKLMHFTTHASPTSYKAGNLLLQPRSLSLTSNE